MLLGKTRTDIKMSCEHYNMFRGRGGRRHRGKQKRSHMVIAGGQWKTTNPNEKVQKEKYKVWGRNVYHHTSLVHLHSEFWAAAPPCSELPPEAKCKNSLGCIPEEGCNGKGFFFISRGIITILKVNCDSSVIP